MERYDPLRAPAPREWLDMDDLERAALVESYHHRAKIRPPNMKAHAIFHVIVENQAALGDETPVPKTLERLMSEGIDRHEAIHAVAAVLSDHMSNIIRGDSPASDPNAQYFAALEKLTVQSWRKDSGPPSPPPRGKLFRR